MVRLCAFCEAELDVPIDDHLEDCDSVMFVDGVPFTKDDRNKSRQAKLPGVKDE